MVFSVRHGGADVRIDLVAALSPADVREAVAAAVGLPPHTFGLRAVADGRGSAFHAGLDGVWEVVLLAAAPGGGGGGGGGGGAALSEARLRAIVREEVARREEPLSISKATPATTTRLLEAAGVYESALQAPPELPADFLPAAPLPPFNWERGEHACTADACARLAGYLAAAGAAMVVDAPPGAAVAAGFRLVDVHTRTAALTAHLGNVLLKGGADAIIVPATQDPAAAVQQARVVVDFKVRAGDFEALRGQAAAELLAASSLSHHDVLVLFTDLNERGHVLRAEGGTLLVWRDLGVREALYLVARFLTDCCAPVGVASLDDARVPGAPAAKRARWAFLDALRGMRPTHEALLDQLAAFSGGGPDDYADAEALVFAHLGGAAAPESAPDLHYFS